MVPDGRGGLTLGLRCSVVPGDSAVRLTLDRDAPQEQRVTVEAGETERAEFPAR